MRPRLHLRPPSPVKPPRPISSPLAASASAILTCGWFLVLPVGPEGAAAPAGWARRVPPPRPWRGRSSARSRYRSSPSRRALGEAEAGRRSCTRSRSSRRDPSTRASSASTSRLPRAIRSRLHPSVPLFAARVCRLVVFASSVGS